MLPVFELENYFLRHEPKASISLCASGLETWRTSEILALATDDERKAWHDLALEYSHPQGNTALREAIAATYQGVAPEDVCVFAGAAEAISSTLLGMLNADDHVIVVTPCYQSLESIPVSCCETSTVALAEDEGWRLDPDAVEAALRANTKMIIVNFPNNPTGYIPDASLFEELAELARRHDLYLFSDEVYRGMELNPDNRLTAAVDDYEKGISVASMSKLYGLPGLRIGWLAAKDPAVLRAATDRKLYASICPNTASELLATIALKNREKILSRNIALLQNNYVTMQNFMKRHADTLSWKTPLGGCLGFAELHLESTAEAFAMQLLEETGVFILPGNLYGKAYGKRIRLGFGRRNFSEALARFESFLISQ